MSTLVKLPSIPMLLPLLLCASGCGYMRQANSPDLRVLAADYGVATIPNQDERIIFQGKTIDDAAFARACEHLKRYGGVEILDLNGQPVTDASIPHILQLPSLRTLMLQGTNLTSSGLKQLASHRRLRALYISETHFTPQELSDLRGTLSRVELIDGQWIRDASWRSD